MALATVALTASGCSKGSAPEASTGRTSSPPAVSADALIEQVGAEPGPVEHRDGPLASVTAVTGTVEVRRLGEEAFTRAPKSAFLYAGDQIRTGDGASARILLADESTVELAEVSTLGIGSRIASAAPASRAAVLSGVARFSVSPRAPGEGSFLVSTPAGMVATKGTVFGVGVAADGDARVGVESGAVEVAGSAAFDAPVGVSAHGALDLAADGTLGAVKPWPSDDWGAWREGAEAGLDVSATAALHASAMEALRAELSAGFGSLEKLAAEVGSFEAEVSAAASHDDLGAYEARLPAGSVAIDASFLAGLRLAWLTDAYLAHAVIASDLYVRHPDVVVWAPLAAEVHAAVLWPKRLDAVALAYLEPLRTDYYLHHPRGRAEAQFVGIAVPAFYARVTPPALPPGHAKKLGFTAFVPPVVIPTPSARAVWIGAPSVGWHATARGHVAPPRGGIAFWVRPPKWRAHATLGADVRGQVAPCFAIGAPAPRGRMKVRWGVALGPKVKLPAPDLQAAAKARLAWHADLGGPNLTAHVPEPDLEGRVHGKLVVGVRGKAAAKADLKAQLHAAKQARARLEADARATQRAAAEARSKLTKSAKAAASVRVQLPEVRPPKVKASVKGSAKLSI